MISCWFVQPNSNGLQPTSDGLLAMVAAGSLCLKSWRQARMQQEMKCVPNTLELSGKPRGKLLIWVPCHPCEISRPFTGPLDHHSPHGCCAKKSTSPVVERTRSLFFSPCLGPSGPYRVPWHFSVPRLWHHRRRPPGSRWDSAEVGRSILSLFQALTGGIDWRDLDEDGFELEMGCGNGLLEPVHSQAGEIFSNYM